MANNPPWLRGPVPDVIPMLQPVAHSLIDCREDVSTRLVGVSVERIWAKPGSAASIGFHVRHAMGSIDRLLTYARGEMLSHEQLATLKTEGVRGTGPDTAEELIAEFQRTIEIALERVRGTHDRDLLEFRTVGRGNLPSNVIGILIHMAEHTQRHVGQMSTTLKIVQMKYVALLRGINVGGNKKVPMADLRAMTAKLGFDAPKTLLQSGNLVFTAKAQPIAKLEALLEDATKKHIGVECSYLLRSEEEWTKIVKTNPFTSQAQADPAHVTVTFCRDVPSASALQALQAEVRGEEAFTARGRELFVWYPDGIGMSKLALALSKNRLGTICTARNWNTVMKVSVLLE